VSPAPPSDLIAEGVWSRLRDVVLSQRRWERFVDDPDGGGSGPEARTVEPPRGAEARRIAEELTLRALRAGVDPTNHEILRRLGEADSATVAELAELTQLPRLALDERVGDLMQVGLVSRAADSQQVHATPLTEGMLGLVDDVASRLAALIDERWDSLEERSVPGR